MTADAANQRILWVDDEPSILMVCKTLLNAEGYDVETAGSGELALGLMSKKPFKAVLTNIRMFPMDGIEFVHTARDRHPDTSFAYVTAYGSRDLCLREAKAGVNDYMTKPFLVDDVLFMVRELLAHGPEWQGKGCRTILYGSPAFSLWVVCDPKSGLPGTLLGRAYYTKGMPRGNQMILENLAGDLASAAEYEPPEGLFPLIVDKPFSVRVKSWGLDDPESREHKRRHLIRQVCRAIADDLPDSPTDAAERAAYRVFLCYEDEKGKVFPIIGNENLQVALNAAERAKNANA